MQKQESVECHVVCAEMSLFFQGIEMSCKGVSRTTCFTLCLFMSDKKETDVLGMCLSVTVMRKVLAFFQPLYPCVILQNLD